MNHETRTEQSASPRDVDWSQLIQVAIETPGSVGNVYNRFYNYSFLNQMFLRLQGVSEPVATYKRWQTMGRQVLRGSKAHAIIRPIVLEQKTDDGETEDKLVRFKPVRCLFTVSQTEGDELPPVELPGWELPRALATLAIQQVPYELLDGNVQGYSSGREFAVNPVAVDPRHTTLHEIGHILLGHTTQDQAAQTAYLAHRGVQEFQAESTAYLTLNELEQLSPDRAAHSRGYIQHWLHDDKPSDALIRQVFSATDAILKAGRPAVGRQAGQ